MIVSSDVRNTMIRFADRYRTDTAQTIMSREGGRAAGHSGSGLSLVGQAEAHNLLRAKIIDLLTLTFGMDGYTERSLDVVLGSITVTSMAPGVVARTIKGGTSSLKAGATKKKEYERNRNKAKLRLAEMHAQLSPLEREFAENHARDFLESTQRGITPEREIWLGMPASPLRDESEVYDEVAGLLYLHPQPSLAADILPPAATSRGSGFYISEPFKNDRRILQ
jgi:hypothetical protein